ncbi:MAG: flexitail domain-containing putative surface protein [Dehalococcoidia bacterium]|nr:flexitail domain-containing putative surface protein [Dehalococcoidia bacterium]
MWAAGAGLALSIAAVAAYLAVSLPLAPRSGAAADTYRIAAAEALLRLDEGDVIAEVLVLVRPGENPEKRARAALDDLYPRATDVDVLPQPGERRQPSPSFTTTGLVWQSLPVTVDYNGGGAPVAGAQDALLAALQTWTDVESSSFAFEFGGSTTRCPSLYDGCPGPQVFDAHNDVGWHNISTPGVLGVTWYGVSTREFDMVVDNGDFTWYAGPLPVPSLAYDLPTVQLHELGHAAGLGHSTDSSAVMAPSLSRGQAKRTPRQDDIDGISSLYPAALPAPTEPPPSAATATAVPATPEPTPTPADPPLPQVDSDGDGCPDQAELGPDETLGGRRDPTNPWDFYDVDGDGVVDVFNDLFAVAFAHGQVPGDGLYSTGKDRSPPPSAATEPDPNKREPWDLRAPDGSVDLFTDIFGLAAQVGHTCM